MNKQDKKVSEIEYVGAYNHFDYSGDYIKSKGPMFGIFDRLLFTNDDGLSHEFVIQQLNDTFTLWQRGDTEETKEKLFFEAEMKTSENLLDYVRDLIDTFKNNGFNWVHNI